MTLVIAGSLDEALAAIARGARPIAGGTDLVVAARQGGAPVPESLVAIDRIPELDGITESDAGLHVGACVTHARLMTDPAIVQYYTAIADASALIGSPSTRNIGTLGGNVMNASPAADTAAPLMVLDARLTMASSSGRRDVGAGDIWIGPGTTSAAADELCLGVDLPARPGATGSAYVRLEYRRAMDIAVVGAAASVSLNDDGTIADARVALTAVAPTIIEVDELDVAGLPADRAAEVVATAARAAARPISDVRASDEYRTHTVGVMAGRAVAAASRRAAGEHIAVPVNRSLGVGAPR